MSLEYAPTWPEISFTPQGEIDWEGMVAAYNARKREARRAGKRMGIEPAILPRQDPFFPVCGE